MTPEGEREKKYLIELFSEMPSNNEEDYLPKGERIIRYDASSTMKLIDNLVKYKVEFTVWEIKECLIDLSYEYWEK